MRGAHQGDGHPTLDLSTRLWVGLPPFVGQATGYPFQCSRRFHPLRLQRGGNVDVSGGKPPGTSSFPPFQPPRGTSLVIYERTTGRQCSRHACREHCLSPAARGPGLEGHPSVPWPLALPLSSLVVWWVWTRPAWASSYSWRDLNNNITKPFVFNIY